MLVLQGEWEYDRYMSKMLWKLKQPHATRASCYITQPGAHRDHKGLEPLDKGFGGYGQSPRSQVTVSSLLCSLSEVCPFPETPASFSPSLLVSHPLLT